MECLEKIIKLSRTDCPCFDDDKPVDFNEGQTEIYLDELEGLSLQMIQHVENCEEGSLWRMMNRARENATLKFKTDLLSCLSTKFVPRRKLFKGLIGDPQFNQTLVVTNPYAGVKIKAPMIEGGVLILNRIGIAMNMAANFNIEVWNNIDPSPVAVYNVNSVANTLVFATIAGGLELPLYRQECTNQWLEYYVIYQPIGFQPKNTKTSCNCGGSEKKWRDWVLAEGTRGTATTNLELFQTSTESNGIILDVTIKCKTEELICSTTKPLDFESNGVDTQMAYAVRFMSGAILIDEILSSSNVNFYTLMAREALYGKRAHYLKVYHEWIEFICDKMDVTTNHCLMCDPRNGFIKAPILK